jgi:glycosyltransferase involved in cell wall biosynthesis/O-antigen ligase
MPAALACFDYAIFQFYFTRLFGYLIEIFLVVLVLADREARVVRRVKWFAAAMLLTLVWTFLSHLTTGAELDALLKAFRKLPDSNTAWLWPAQVWLAAPVLLDRPDTRGVRRYSETFRFAVFALLLFHLLSFASVLNSFNPGASLDVFETDLGLYIPLLTAWLRACHADPWLRRATGIALAWLMGALTLISLTIALAAIFGGDDTRAWLAKQTYIYIQPNPSRHAPAWRLNFPARYFNTAGHFFLLATGVFILAALRPLARPARRWAPIGLAVLAFYLICITGTRGAVAGVLAGLAIWALLCSRRTLIGIVALMLAGVALLPGAKRQLILSMFNPATYTLSPERPTSMSLRYAGWISGARMVRHAPWTGIGYGHENIRRSYDEFSRGTGDIEDKRHLHNVPLEFAAESGLPAAIVFLVWCCLRWQMIGRVFLRTREPAMRRRAAAWLAFEGAIFIFGLVSFSLRRPFALLTWGLWGYVLSEMENAVARVTLSPRTDEKIAELEPARARAWEEYDRRRAAWFEEHTPAEDPDGEGLIPLRGRWDRERALEGRRAANPISRAIFNGRLLLSTARAWWRSRSAPPAAMPTGRPMRVMQIVGRLAMGGVAKVLCQTLLRLDSSQVRTTLLVHGSKNPVSSRLANHPGLEAIARPLELWPPSWNFRLWKDVDRLGKMIGKSRPDLIHLHEPNAAPAVRLAAARAGVPLLIQLHSAYSGRRDEYPPLHRWLERRALRSAWLMGHTPEVLEDAGRYVGSPPAGGRRAFLADDGVDDLRLWRRDSAMESWMLNAAGGRKIVVLIARLVPLKRIDDFLAVARRLIDRSAPIFPVLMVYGGGRRRRRQRVFRHRFRTLFAPGEAEWFQFVGFPPDLIRHASAAVSCSEVEGLPMSVMEFMALGVPVVCSDIPAHRELVADEESALLFPVGDLDALEARLTRVLTDESIANRLAARARQAIQDQQWQRTADQVTAIYRAILSGSPPPSHEPKTP